MECSNLTTRYSRHRAAIPVFEVAGVEIYRRLSMADALTATAQRVQDAVAALGVASQVVELPASTRSAAEAAQAIGCRVEQIAKSLVFRGSSTNRPVLAIVSGANRVDEERLGELIAEVVAKADADYVRQRTGFAIGGVPPVGHAESLVCLIDEDLFQYDVVWAAAGTPRAVFRLTPAELQRITGGRVVSVKGVR
jgi:prolyl-tRNA editing enzyme YbaK/EbsC (Cys-tRNA(Pro) deacylase)